MPIFRPNQDVSIGAWTTAAGGTSNLFQQIDEADLDTADYVKYVVGASTYTFRINSGSVDLGDVPILSLTVHAVAVVSSGASKNLRLDLVINGNLHAGTDTAVSTTQTTVTEVWETNPETDVAWTAADIALFDTTDELTVVSQAPNPFEMRVYQVFVDVALADVPVGMLPVGF